MPLMLPSLLRDYFHPYRFNASIRPLIDAGDTTRALCILREVAKTHGHDDLVVASDPDALELRIAGWEHVRRDCAAAVFNAACPVGLKLKIVARSSGDRQGVLWRTLYRRDDHSGIGIALDSMAQVIRVVGLEQLFSLLLGSDNERRRDLCAWLIIALYIRAVNEQCAHEPLPENTVLVLEADFTPRSMESGFIDLLPHFSCRIEPALAASADTTEELCAERHAENLASFQKTWEDDFAKRREIHRMIGYFPFYRVIGRASLAKLWVSQLAMVCDIVGIDPKWKISWRMSPGKLTDILRQIAEAKNVPDIEAALNPIHTDRLHTEWLPIARAADFKLGPGTSLFEVQLAVALHKGGPWVEDRWQHAKPYRAGRKFTAV